MNGKVSIVFCFSSLFHLSFRFGRTYERSIVLILIVCILISLTGCVTSFKEGFKDAGLSSALKEKDYEVLGFVTMHSAITNILGFISFGGRGYEELLEIAKEQYVML